MSYCDSFDRNLISLPVSNVKVNFISYGVRICILVNDATISELLSTYLPPCKATSETVTADKMYTLTVSRLSCCAFNQAHYTLLRDQEELAHTTGFDEVLDSLEFDLRIQVATSTKDKLFVHAGVAGWRGKAIVIPGRSFSGKTTLVAALIEAGATYYSDEYAVFDTKGFVHPYPRPLSVRQGEGKRVKKCPVKDIGAKVGTKPLPVGLVVHTIYQPEKSWCPNKITRSQAILALFDNTIVARLRPKFALQILAVAVTNALALAGKRGDAKATAVDLLKQLVHRQS